jgi:hypothetical protein
VYPAVLLIYFIFAAVILPASLALIDQVSLPYNKTGRASVLYNFILATTTIIIIIIIIIIIPLMRGGGGGEGGVIVMS